MVLTEVLRKPWKRPVIKTVTVVAPLSLVCTSGQFTCCVGGCASSCNACGTFGCAEQGDC